MNLDEFIATASPRTKTVSVCGRGDLAARHDELVAELEKIALDPNERSLAGNPRALEVAGEIGALEDEMEESTLTVTMSALSRNAWADLLAAHPPSREQAKLGYDNDPTTFAPAAVSLCAVEPTISMAQAKQLGEKLSSVEWSKLWFTVAALNTMQTSVPKMEAATELLRVSGRSSTTPALAGSPAAPSSDGSGDQSPPISTATGDV